MSSSSLVDSSRIDLPAAVRDGAKEVRVGDGPRFDEINRAAEQRFEVELQPHVSLERSGDRLVAEVDEKVIVALVGVEVRPRRRPEQLQPSHAVTPAQVVKLVT